MILQSIMDATPAISWSENRFGEHIGSSHERSYLLGNDPIGYILYWYSYGKKMYHLTSADPQEIIDKINELEGVK